MLVDDVKITVKAGNGGHGAATFRRNSQTAKGGPDGGNGGNGGSIYVEATHDLSDLRQFRYTKKITAADGTKGQRNNLYGKNAEDTVIRVPIGTRVTDLTTGAAFDLEKDNEKILVARGGRGGLGNNSFKTPTNQAPHYAELGEEGEKKEIRFELRIIAQVGLIGLPNAGKSSLLQVLTNANPKIGDYPFTTLEPNLGSLDGVILADIPGLIEGASAGKGLGLRFLKHIEKTQLLIHCIDSTEKDIAKAYNVVRKELEEYQKELVTKKEIIFLTKIDLLENEEIEKKEAILKKQNPQVYKVSIYNEEKIKEATTLIKSLKNNDY
jgi:GTPase